MTTYFVTFKMIMIFWVLASKVAFLKFWLATYIAKQNFKQVTFILYPKCSVVRFQEAYNLLPGSMACISFTEPIKNKVLFLWDSMSLAFSEALCSLNLMIVDCNYSPNWNLCHRLCLGENSIVWLRSRLSGISYTKLKLPGKSCYVSFSEAIETGSAVALSLMI